MNFRLLAWILVVSCALGGGGYLAEFLFDRISSPGDASSSAIKSAPLQRPLLIHVSPTSSPEQRLHLLVDSTDFQQQEDDLHEQIADWTSHSPLDAARFVQSMPIGLLRTNALRILAQTWGHEDAETALSWSASHLEKSERDTFVTNLCLGLARRDPEAAIQLACDNHDCETGLLENLTQQWAEKEPRTALSWVIEQPPGQARDQLLQRIALVESKNDPAEAAGLVVQQMRPGPEQTEAAISVVQQWAERDWNGAAAWVDQFPEGTMRDRAIAELNGIARE